MILLQFGFMLIIPIVLSSLALSPQRSPMNRKGEFVDR